MHVIGQIIRERRKQKNLTQQQLANRLNVSNRTVSKWERGDLLPNVYDMAAICRHLEISFDEVFEIKDVFPKENDFEEYINDLKIQLTESNAVNQQLQQEKSMVEQQLYNRVAKDSAFLKVLIIAGVALVIVLVISVFSRTSRSSKLVTVKFNEISDITTVLISQDHGDEMRYYRKVYAYIPAILDNQVVEKTVINNGIQEYCHIITCRKEASLFGSDERIYQMIDMFGGWSLQEMQQPQERQVNYLFYYEGDLDELDLYYELDTLMNLPKIILVSSIYD